MLIEIQNDVYLKELNFLNNVNSKWHYYFSDQVGEFVIGNVDQEIKNINRSGNTISIIFLILLLPILPVAFYSFNEERNFLKKVLFYSGLLILFVTIIIIDFSTLSVSITLNMWNSVLMLIIPISMLVMFIKKQKEQTQVVEHFTEISI